MKNVTLLFALMCTSFFTLQAQAPFKPGQVELAAGVGIFSTYAKDGAQSIVPPVSLRADVRLAERFTVGAYAAYSKSEVNNRLLPDGTFQDIRNESLMLGLRAAAHGSVNDKVNIYGGALLAYDMPTVDESINGLPKSANDDQPSFVQPAANKFLYSAFVGASYYTQHGIGFFGEVGYGISILNAGLTIRL